MTVAIRRVFLVTLLLVVTSAVATLYAWRSLNRPVSLPEEGVILSVSKGASFRRIARQLARAGVIEHPHLLIVWARFRGLDRQVPSGELRFAGRISALDALGQLRAPARLIHSVTIPEGRTAEQVAIAFEEAGFGGRDVFLQAMADPVLLQALDLPASGAEGFLFPDTYVFDWETEPGVIVRRMVERFRLESRALAAARIETGLSEVEMVILASLIEKEAARAEERPLISGVFRNRLRLGMRLQSDPTVLYGRPADASGPLTRSDLAHPSPYNTYVHRGLPPGPIANPGRAALQAAVSPAETRALYFVARNDGSHEFSSTLADHNRAVRRYQRGKRG
jgi:UPF0755 protein